MTPRFDLVPVDRLAIDVRYQRPRDRRRVERMAANFDDRLVGALEVSSPNGRGLMAVFDGQHRLEAAKIAGVRALPCLVHDDLTPEQEASYFVSLQQNRKAVKPVDRFRAAVFAKEPRAIAINEIVTRHGFRVANRNSRDISSDKLGAVDTIERVYTLGLLDETLSTMRMLWHDDPAVSDARLIGGMARFLEGYDNRLHKGVDRLRKIGPQGVLNRAHRRLPPGTASFQAWEPAVMKELISLANIRGPARIRSGLGNG